jgi:methionyl-tRNA formyltransferase
MKAGVISNSELCIPLLHYLKLNNREPILYLGSYNADTNISSLISFCNSNNISIEVEKNCRQLFSWLSLYQPDHCFVFGYKKLIDVDRLGEFKKTIFNIHPGKLPEYRGASPVFWQLKNGEETLGLTIHFMNGSYDAGEIVWSKQIRNEAHFSHGLVEFIFSNLLMEGVQYILNSSLDELVKRKVLQDESRAVTYKKPMLADVLIKWQTMQAVDVINLVRAVNPWNRGAITMCNGMEVKIVDAELVNIETDAMPGTIIDTKDGIKVSCAGKGAIKINHLNVNEIFVPARFAGNFGLASGQHFASP